MRRVVCALAALLCVHALAVAQPCGRVLTLQVVPGFSSPVVSLAVHPTQPRTLFALTQSGVIRRIENDVAGPTMLTLTGFGSDNAGYGLAIDPDYETTGHIYVFGPTGSTSSILRFTRSPNEPNVLTQRTTILVVPALPTQHTGGWIGFGNDRLLYLGLGDHFTSTNSQATNNWLGKLLRIDPRSDDFPEDANRNYAIPPANPVAGNPFLREVVAVGLRNPFRCGFDTLTGDLHMGDVGGSQREEVSVFPAGSVSVLNFGWPCREGKAVRADRCREGDVLTNPILDLTRSESSCITGGFVYRGAAIPWLSGRYIYGSCTFGAIRSFDPSNPRATLRSHTASGFLSLAADRDGELYVGTSSGMARLVAAAPPAASSDCNANGVIDSCEISSRLETDYNTNARPDSCERTCIADWNLSGSANQADIDAFITLWLLPGQAADVNGDGIASVIDLFEFLNAWLRGCS